VWGIQAVMVSVHPKQGKGWGWDVALLLGLVVALYLPRLTAVPLRGEGNAVGDGGAAHDTERGLGGAATAGRGICGAAAVGIVVGGGSGNDTGIGG